jgi:hypothetical protein
MRIHPTHDWHIDIRHNDWTPPQIDLDVVICNVGDLRAPGTLSIIDYRRMYPRHGYPEHFIKNSPRENPDFDPELVIEVGYDCVPRMGGVLA